MKCPKCGYHSFEHLVDCKKCGQSLADHKAKFNLSGFIVGGQAAVGTTHHVIPEDSSDEPAPLPESVDDFGFDFLEAEIDPGGDHPAEATSENDFQDISIDQPFRIDNEALPTNELPPGKREDSDDKPDKGPEFAF